MQSRDVPWTPTPQQPQAQGEGAAPGEAQPPAPTAESSPEDRLPIRRHGQRGQQSVGKSDDFVEISLNSPASARGLLGRNRAQANGTPAKSSPVVTPPRSVVEEEAVVSDGGEVARLKDQLKRLKAQMVSSAAAQEEEQARLQEEVEEAVRQKEELGERLRRQERAGLDPAVEQQWQQRVASLEAQAAQHQEQMAQEVEQRKEAIRSLEAQRDQQRAEQEAASQQLAASRHQIDELEARCRESAGMEAELAELRSSRADRQGAGISDEEVEALRQSVEAGEALRESQAQDFQRRLDEQGEALARLESELAAERDAHEGTLKDAEAALMEVETLRAQQAGQHADDTIQTLQTQLSAESAARREAEAALQEANEKLRAEAAAAAEAREAQGEAEVEWSTHAEGLRASLGASQAEVARLAGLESALREENERIKNQLHAREEQDGTEVASLKAGMRKLEGEVERLERELADAQSTAEQQGREVARLALELREAQDALQAEKEGRLQHARAAEARMEQEVAAAMGAAEEAAREREGRLQEQLGEVQEALGQAREELESLRAANSDLRQAAQSAEALEQELQGALRECESLGDQLLAAEAKCSSLAREAEEEAETASHLRTQVTHLQRLVQADGGDGGRDSLAESKALADLREEAQAMQDSLTGQLLKAQASASRLQAELDHLRASGNAASSGGEVEAEVAALKEALQLAEGERDKAKQQLSRLKQQMVSEQDEEDSKLQWRVEQEVGAAASAREVAEARERAMSARVEVAERQTAAMEEQLGAWEAAVAERDAELQNLQGALGELTYESEAAEKLRVDIRTERAAARELRDRLAQAQAAVARVEAEKGATEHRLQDLEAEAGRQQEREQRLIQEANMLRRAVQESMKRINLLNSDSSAMVDRRIVTKLLVTYFQRGQSPELLDLMARMLGLSEEDKGAIKGSRRGVLRSVAVAPFNLLSRANSSASDQNKESLADSWVDFLIQQAEAANAADQESSQKPPESPTQAGL